MSMCRKRVLTQYTALSNWLMWRWEKYAGSFAFEQKYSFMERVSLMHNRLNALLRRKGYV